MNPLFAWFLGKAFYTINFALYRLASWTGTLYLYRKARQKGRKIYYLAPAAVYAASWLLLLVIAGHGRWGGYSLRLMKRIPPPTIGTFSKK